MLADLYQTGLQLISMIGLCSLLYGVFVLIGALSGGGPFGLVKGSALIAFGVYLAGLGHSL